ncbi:HAMP domain-containing sensor histidine kinase [Nonomuraea sp. NPDC005983]|uniref:sensor histidine kinase n=1 Tax=Nonomuraea sp. NPDC005983 TaxID=3155595 RepID=UPI0033AFCFF5
MVTRFGRSVRARLTLLASVTMALFCLLASSLLLYGLHNTALEYRKNEVLGVALRVVHQVKRGTLPAVVPTDLDGIQVVDTAGRVTASSANLVGQPRLTTFVPDPDEVNKTQIMCGLPVLPGRCEIAVVFRVYEKEGEYLIYAFVDTVPWYVTPAVLASVAGASAGLVALAWFGTSRVVAGALAPVDRIRDQLAEITATADLRHRVPAPRNVDEIRVLARSVNQTLDRLEAVVEDHRRFASDASHDLRSPITAMRAQVEEALLHPEDADWEHTGQALLASLDRLQAIVADLLTLARLDAGEPGVCEDVGLSELVTEEAARPRSKQVVRTLQPGVVVRGDRLRLARLLTNLLDNAERHAESTIIVSLRRHDDQAVVEVLDDGGGIAPDQREYVFQRFARLDASRNRDAGGTGLGLPIARDIALAHGGTLALEDSDSGARFVLRLPTEEG